MMNNLMSVWILVRKNQLDSAQPDGKEDDHIHPILPPLYAMLTVLFSVLFGCTGIYYSSEALIAIYSILTVVSVPISVLVMLRIKIFIHVIFICIICMLSLMLLHHLKGHKDSDSRESLSERSSINRDNTFTPYCMSEDFAQLPRPPKYQDISPPIRPPRYEDLFGLNTHKFVATV